MKTILVVVVAIVLFALALAFGVQNTQVVVINYLIAQGQLTVSALVGIALFCGFLLGIVLSSSIYLRLRWRQHRLQRTIRRQRRELERSKQSSDGVDAE